MSNDVLLDCVLRPKGRVRIYDEDGLITESHNMVVRGYRPIMVNLLVGNTLGAASGASGVGSGWAISRFKVSNGTDDPDFQNTKLSGETGGTDVLFVLNKSLPLVSGADYSFFQSDSSEGSYVDTVRFYWTMNNGDGNATSGTGGVDYTEAGMYGVASFVGDGGSEEREFLFSRVVFSPIRKGPSRRLTFEWIISFT